jgi:hypothetical protein
MSPHSRPAALHAQLRPDSAVKAGASSRKFLVLAAFQAANGAAGQDGPEPAGLRPHRTDRENGAYYASRRHAELALQSSYPERGIDVALRTDELRRHRHQPVCDDGEKGRSA